MRNLKEISGSPRFIYNNYKNGTKVSSDIRSSLERCDSFYFSIAFISESGLAVLKQTLLDLQVMGVKGKIITSTYLNFNRPKLFRELLKFENIEVRIYQNEGFHSKGYIFEKEDRLDFIIGSSNLTQNALSINQEWNIGFSQEDEPDMARNIIDEFYNQWNDEKTVVLSETWIDDYEENYEYIPRLSVNKESMCELKPNYMQKEALYSLNAMRIKNKERALLISATGTGKTYLAAFDVRVVKPKRMLFVVHRENIARAAMKSFKNVIDESKYSMGMFTGTEKDDKKDYLFATIQTIGKEEYFKNFKHDEFEYIIVDEVHKAGASSYLTLLNYFKPKFLLGMSATPERSDDFDIFKLFDYNIAYEIRLQQAMEYDLLCPFHYYGVTDLIVDGKTIDDKTDFERLISSDRVEHICKAIETYGYSGDRVRGLIFCSRIKEANDLSKLFNQRGYRTLSLTGSDNEDFRKLAMDRLEQEEGPNALDYIFTVDIFNEGIDIPKVNQIVMLRPTKSAIIFIQQLGRGLRKNVSKEYVVVIDFIGNYENNFMIPVALSGNKSYNGDAIRKYIISDMSSIPGASTIQFDQIAKKRIFDSIEKISGIKNIIKNSYNNLKARLGKIPTLYDFYFEGEIDPLIIVREYGSYYKFIEKIEKDVYYNFSKEQLQILDNYSKNIIHGKRVFEAYILKMLLSERTVSIKDFELNIKNKYDISADIKTVKHACFVLNCKFHSTAKQTIEYENIDIVKCDNVNIYITKQFENAMINNDFKNQLIDIVDVSLAVYSEKYRFSNINDGFVLYQKYTRRDVCQLLNCEKDLSSVMYGMKKIGDNTCLFVTYHKQTDEEDDTYLAGKPDYADEFADKDNFMWDSQMGKGPDSPYMNDVTSAKNRHLFVKKNDKEIDFYYLGKCNVENVVLDSKLDKNNKKQKISKVKLSMHNSIREDFINYFESK